MDISIYTADFTDKFGIDGGYKKIAETGFTAIDWSLPRAWHITETRKTGKMPDGTYILKPMDEIKKFLQPHVDAIRKYGLRITQSHAEIGVFFADNELYTEQCITAYCNTLRICEWVGCKYLIIHSLSMPNDTFLTYEEILDRNISLFSRLIPVIKETGVRVCFENIASLFVTNPNWCALTLCDPYEAVSLIDTLNGMAGEECFAFCLDTGHLNIMHRMPRYFINILGHRLQTLHINDNDSLDDQHFPPYNGTVDWDDFLDGLTDIGYKGDLNFETCVMPYYEGIYKCGVEFRERLQGK